MYKANWNPEPMIHIASRDWTRRAGTGALPVTQPVDVYSNLGRVELIVNGTSLGFREPDDVKSAHWDAPLVAGDNSIVARGEKNGRPYADQLTIHLDHYPQDLRNAAAPFRELAVNVGSNAQYSDGDGLVWVADQAYRPGSFGFVGGERKLFPRPVVVAGSHRTGLLVTYREGLEGYRFDVPDGEYEVELNFAEPTDQQAGQRVFGVAVNGQTILPRLDLAAREGLGRALPVLVRINAAGGEGIRVSFQPVAGQPILNGILVRRR
jgi:beta-galactosidase